MVASQSQNEAERQALNAHWADIEHPDSAFENESTLLAIAPEGASHVAKSGNDSTRAWHIAVSDGTGGVFTLLQPLTYGAVEAERRYERLYIFGSLCGIALMGALLALAVRVRTGRRARVSGDALLLGRPLAWVLAIGAAIFAVDMNAEPDVALGIAYVIVVLVSLSFSQSELTWFAATYATALTALRLLVGTRALDEWDVLANNTLSVFAVWSVAALGQWQRAICTCSSACAIRELRAGQGAYACRAGGKSNFGATARPLKQSRAWRRSAIGSWMSSPARHAGLPKSAESVACRPAIRSLSKRPCGISRWTHASSSATPSTMRFGTARRSISRCRSTQLMGVRCGFVHWGSLRRATAASRGCSVPFRTSRSNTAVRCGSSRIARLGAEGHWEYDAEAGTMWTSSTFEELLGFEPREAHCIAGGFS